MAIPVSLRATCMLAVVLLVADAVRGQSGFEQVRSLLARASTAPPRLGKGHALMPEQLNVDWDYVLDAQSGSVGRLAAGDAQAARTLETLRAKRDSIPDHVQLLLALARSGGAAGVREIAANTPQLFGYHAAAHAALARGFAEAVDSFAAAERPAVWRLVLQCAWRGLMAGPDTPDLKKLFVRAVEARGPLAEDARLGLDLAKTHPRDPQFNAWAACHLAGLWIGDRPPEKLPALYPDDAACDYPRAIEHAKAAKAGYGSDRLFQVVFEWILIRIAFERMKPFALNWGERDRVVRPSLERLDALLAQGPLPYAHVVEVLALSDLRDGPATLAALAKCPPEARSPALEKLATEAKALAASQAVEGVPGAIFRKGGYTEHSEPVRAAVRQRGTLQVWYRIDSDEYLSVTFQAFVFSKTGEVLATVAPIAVERGSKRVRDDAGNELCELLVPDMPELSRIGSLEVATLGETRE